MRQYDVKNQKVVLDEEVKVEPLVNDEVIKEVVTPIKQEKVFIGATKLGKKYKVGEKIIEEISLMKDNFILSEENNRLVSKEAQSFKASFAKNISDAKLLTITKDNHEISLSLVNKKRSFKRFVNYECNNNDMLYKNIEDGVDLKYSCMEEGIKESLIINNKQDNYDFDFTLDIKDLTPKFNEETNTLELQKDGETIYTILSPYMIDANEKRSDDCYYEISADENILTLSLRVNADWVNDNERVFPVIIDPTIKVNISDIFHMHVTKDIGNDTPCTMTQKTLYTLIEKNVDGEVFSQNIYANIKSQNIASSIRSRVYKAYVTLNIESISGDYNTVVLKVSKNNVIIKKLSGNKDLKKIEIDVTSEVKSGSNIDIELAFEYNSSMQSYYAKYTFYTPLADEPNCSCITLEYNEQDIVNTKEYNIGNGGTTSVNVKNGDFIHEIPLTTVSHNSLDLGISAIFDSKDFENNKNYFMGKGWRTNLHQFLVKSSDFDIINGCKDVTYIDAQGIKHILHEKWYYLDDNLEKVYIDRNNVFIDSDKKLKVFINDKAYEVKYDVKSDEGLSFMSGSSLSEYISKANLKTKKTFKLEYGNGCKEFYELCDDGRIFGNVYCFFDENRLEEIIVPFKNVKFENNSPYYFLNETNIPLYLTKMFFYLRCDRDGFYFVNKDIGETIERLKEDLVTYDVNQKIEDIYFNEDIQNVESQIKYLENNVNSYFLSLKEISNTLNQEIGKLQSAAYEEKLKDYTKIYYDSVEKLKQLNEYKSALIEEQRRKVNDFITDENGNTLGFDGYGRLILVMDAYENKIEVTYGYDKDNKDELLSVSSETQTIKFKYQTNKLSYILDSLRKKHNFYYMGTELHSLSMRKNFLYLSCENGFKVSVANFGSGIEITKITNGIKVRKEVSASQNATTEFNNGVITVLNQNYVFDNNNTKIYDVLNNNKLVSTIYFDVNGNIDSVVDDEKISVSKHINNKINQEIVMKTNPTIIKREEIDKEASNITFEYSPKNDDDFLNNIDLSRTIYSSILALKLDIKESLINNKLPLQIEITTLNASYYEVDFTNLTNPIVFSNLLLIPFVFSNEVTKILISINGDIDYILDDKVSTISIVKLESIRTYKYDKNEECLIETFDGTTTTTYTRYIDKLPLTKTETNIYGETVRTNYTYDNNNHLTSEIDSKGNVIEYYYDDKGKCIEKRSYNTKDASLMRVEKVSYDDKGRVINSLGQIKDTNGNYPTKEITYLPNSNIPTKVKNYNNESICYNYDFKTGELLSISSSINGVNNATNFTYNFGLLTSMSHHGVKVNYEYDGKGRRCKTLLNGEEIITNTYVEHFDYLIDDIELEDSSYVTSEMDEYFVIQVTDKKGLLRCIEIGLSNSKGKVINTYNDDNQLVKVVNGIYGFSKDIIEVIKNEYDGELLKKVIKSIGEDEEHQVNQFVLINTYDENKRFLLSSAITLSDTYNYSLNYKYNTDHQITEVTIKENKNNEDVTFIITNYELDSLNRISHQVIKLGSLEICNEYNYLKQDENSLDLISEEVTKIKTTKNNVISYGLDTNSYKYDVNGNIISIINDDYQIRYQYDKCNRLIREDNPLINKTIIYKYDNSGNILLKKNYDYSEDEILHNLKVDEYIYDCEKGLDHLIRYNGLEITYDKMGRPTTYKGNKLTWNSNGELLTYKDNIKYNYDINGIRTKKVVNGKTHNYVVNGTQILQEKIVEGTSTTIINYHYVLNKLVGFTYNKGGEASSYIYRRNLQGDIIGIYDSLGNEVGWYDMDDWRLTGQEEYLFNVELKKINRKEIKNKSDLWHEHCEFCMETISNKYEQDVYSTKDEYRWICKKCFNDFKEKFKWIVKK